MGGSDVRRGRAVTAGSHASSMEGSPGIQVISLFDLNPSSPLLSNLSLSNNANGKEDSSKDKVKPPEVNDRETKAATILEISDRMTCSACQCVFDTREEQKEHYTLDWHRFNLQRRLKGAAALSEEDFQDKTRAGDVSSISGSDSESSDELESGTTSEPSNNSAPVTAQSSRAQRVLFRNGERQLVSVYRSVLGVTKDVEVMPEHLLTCVRRLQEQPVVVILMAGGGHFAGAVYKGKDVVKHKTFHRYTVRAKRGSAQSVHDAQNRGHMAKSAGAALRRYNQAALMADIHQLLQSWEEHIEEAHGIFLRAPRSDKTLFLGRNSPITRKDPRVFGIPFCTRRATFRELHRVHTHLFALQLYEKDALSSLVSGTREKGVRSRRCGRTQTEEETADAAEVSEEEVPAPEEFVEEELTISTLDLREYEVQPKRKRKKKKKRDGMRPVQDEGETGPSVTSPRTVHDHVDEDSATEETENRTPHPASTLEGDELCRVRNVLFTCCKTGHTETAKQILEDLLPSSSEDPSIPRRSTPEVVQKLVNERLPVEERTLLHVAAAAGQGEIVCLLMGAGWDPALRDSAAQTPYSLSADKHTRNSFRKYREENPEKYNYSKSQIPEPISEGVEARKAEKKRVQRAQRKQKEKEDKEERLRREAEEAEKKRFAALSDREKRAIAAERRLAAQLSLNNVRRCWQCGESLLGKMPFEYLEFSFCTTRCLQEHRRSQAAKCQK